MFIFILFLVLECKILAIHVFYQRYTRPSNSWMVSKIAYSCNVFLVRHVLCEGNQAISKTEDHSTTASLYMYLGVRYVTECSHT
jgi:hypothetical protein